jgi:hypothetical protein
LDARHLNLGGGVGRFTSQDHPGSNVELGELVAGLMNELAPMSQKQNELVLGFAGIN